MKTQFITTEKHDVLIDPENEDGEWILRRNGGIRLNIASESDEVIFSLRVEDNVWHGYAEHVADWYDLLRTQKHDSKFHPKMKQVGLSEGAAQKGEPSTQRST